MELTKEQKYRIYLEEQERLKEEEKKLERDLINSLTDEDKQKIIEEIEARNLIYVTEKDILYPDKKQTRNYGVFFTLAVMSLFINVFLGAVFLISVIGYYVFLGATNRMIMDPNISYHCPRCEQKHINIIRPEEKQQQQRTGSIKATCLVCKYKFRLVVGDVVLQKLNIK